MKYQSLSKRVLIVIGLLTAFFLWKGSQIKYDYDFTAFFPLNHEDTEFFKEYQQKFQPDDNYVLIAIKNSDGIFNLPFLGSIDSLSSKLSNLPYVYNVTSPTTIKEYRRYALYPKLVEVPLINLNQPNQFIQDSLKIMNHPQLKGSFFSAKSPAVILMLRHDASIDETQCLELSNSIRQIVDQYGFNEVHYAGRSFGQSIYIDIIQNDVLVFVSTSVFLVILFLFFSYRSLWGIWMPLSVVGLTTIWTIGCMVLTGKSIDIISNIIPTILMVIGLSSVIHLFTNYLDRRRKGDDLDNALFRSIKEVGMATIFTTLTTMIGFLTLLNSGVKPVIELGIYTTIGLIIALFLTYTWFPALVYIFKPGEDKHQFNESFWNDKLNGLYEFVLSHKNAIFMVSGIIVVFGIWGSSEIRQNNFILEDLKADHPQQQAFQFIEKNFAGARPFELYIRVTDSTASLFDYEIMSQLVLLDSFLQADYGVGALTSPASIVKSANQINHQGNGDYYRIPESSTELVKIKKDILKYGKQVDIASFIKRNHMEARIAGFVPDLGSAEFEKRNNRLNEFFRMNLDTNRINYKITGTASLVDLNTVFVSNNVLEGLLIAFLIIGLIIGVMFKSIKMAFISLVPNIFPLLVTGGIMGFAHIDLKMSTSLIFIISFGIAVDDSIHFLSRFNQELKKNNGRNANGALRNTFLGTGKAIIITSLIISGGFLTLCFSSFLGTFYIGVLICATLITALLADLFLLPALVLTFWKKQRDD